MAKNVSITEDGKNKVSENVAKIRTSLIGGGTCDWIPKDDVPLETLEVSEDGTYRPSEDYYGFDKVIASGVGTVTMGELIEKTVTKNGTYNITDESGTPYGYSKIVVNVDTSDDSGGDSGGGGGGGGGNRPIVGKDEDGNDTMAETDDDGNIVMTALPTDIKVIIPPSKLEYNRYEEIDYSGISVYAYISKEIHWLGTTATAVTEGSSDNTVSIGGSNVTASVGDGVLYAPDRTGQNDVQLVWNGTKWVKPSNYSAEKAVWKSDKYPTGKIPFDELIFPIKRINYLSEYNTYDSEDKTFTYDDSTFITHKSVTFMCSTSIDGDVIYEEYPAGIKEKAMITIHAPAIIPIRFLNNSKVSMSYDDYYDYYALIITYSDNLHGSVEIEGNEEFSRYSVGAVDARRSQYAFSDISAVYNGRIEYGVNGAIEISFLKRKQSIAIGSNSAPPYSMPPMTEADTSPITHNLSVGLFSFMLLSGGINSQTNLTGTIDVVSTTGRGVQETLYSISGNCITIDMPYSTWSSSEAKTDFIDKLQKAIDNYDQENEKKTIPISLPVQWKRPGDGKILETTFTAWMKDDGNSNNASGNTKPGNQNIDVPQ